MAVQAPPQPQQYCLRWNNHQHNLLSVFEDLLNHEAFVDVTIACDGLNLKAHKMVLSACSPYFQSMFYNTPDKHPIVFLKDVRYDEMKALLEFMYRGEVSVDQENLSSLLKVAEGLKIKGLADVNENHSAMSGPVAAPSTRLPLPLPHPPSHLVPGYPPGLMSPEGSIKRLHSATSPNYLGPKRKRGRPRRLSGSEAVPLALSLGEQELEERGAGGAGGARSESRASPLPLDTSESEQSPIKSLKEGSRALSLSPGDSKVNDFHSEADSNDGRSSGVSQVSCEPDVVHILDMSQPHRRPPPPPRGQPVHSTSQGGQPSHSRMKTTTTVIDNRALTIQTFKLEPGMSLEHLGAAMTSITTAPTTPSTPSSSSSSTTNTPTKIKLEPGLLQTLPPEATPLKVEIQDNYLDADIEGALIIADGEEMTMNNMTLDYLINDDGTCTCKLCGEVTASRTHWYRHKYKVHNVCLFKCDKCEVYFKSKKGYEGHVANRHAPRFVGADGKLKSKKEMEGLNKVLKEIQAKKEAEMVQKIIEKVKAECKAQGEDVDRRGYTKHYSNNS